MPDHARHIAPICAVSLLLVFAASPSISQETPPVRTYTSEILLRLGDYAVYERSFRVSPDSRHVAVAAKGEDGSFVVVDGKEGPRFPRLADNSISFGPDGDRVAYAAGDGAGWHVVVDGVSFGNYSSVKDEPPVFSPDGGMLAFAASDPGGEFVAELGLSGGRPDVAGVEGTLRQGSRYDSIVKGGIAYGPDGTLVYVAVRKGMKHLVYGGGEGPACDDIYGPVFGRAGKGMAYLARKGGVWHVVTGVGEGRGYQFIKDSSLMLDGEGVPVYSAFSAGKHRVVLGETEGPPRDEIKGLAVGPGGRVAYGARSGGVWTVCVDGKDGPGYDRLGGYVYISPDGGHVAYIAMRGGEWFAVLDGKEIGPYMSVNEKSLVFSPDGGRLAYAAQFGQREWAPVVDGVKLKPAHGVLGELAFSPDGRRLASIGISGPKQYVAVDGVSAGAYDGIVTWSGGRVMFDGDKGLYYLAVDKKVIFLVEEFLE